jgi:O-methyltransferase
LIAALQKLIKRLLERSGFQIQRLYHGRPNPIHLWDDDKPFNDLMREIEYHTVVDKVRCFMLYQLAQQIDSLPGDAAEVGVYKGGTARILAKVFTPQNKIVHLFDTFAGMPSSDSGKDIHKEGDFSDSSLEKVKLYLRECRNVRFYPGMFPQAAKTIEDINFCFVHIDVDIYKSVMGCCAFFYPRMIKGGMIVFDDYGFLSCPGAKLAVDEFFLNKPEKPCYLPSGQSIVIRQ